jgi:Lipase maturation factor
VNPEDLLEPPTVFPGGPPPPEKIPAVRAAPPAPTYWLTRFLILRLLGAVYAVAFLVAANQLVPLVGRDGLIPAGVQLDQVTHESGSAWAGFLQYPSIFWFGHSDGALLAWSWVGFALAMVVTLGYANAVLLGALWFLYMSIVHVGLDWYGYGWEIQLLETGFLGIFLCPLLDGRPFPRRETPLPVIWLFRWLIFRIMLGSGLIKIRGDEAWRNLTALDYHFETQPIPNGLSRWFHFLPRLALRFGVLYNHLAELVAPWFVFWPRLARHIAGVVIVLFQVVLIFSGNLSFLNWLTIIPALACFDDGFWRKMLPRALGRWADQAEARAQPSRPMRITAWITLGVLGVLSLPVVANLLSSSQAMNTSFDTLHLVNTYGAFGTVGRARYNVVFEGTDDDSPTDAATWKAYPYKGLPVDLRQRPPQIAPYQLRLDWQMWFAAMSDYQHYPWTLNLVWKLLHNDPQALSLFAGNPFPDHPPHYVRAVLYKYKFAPPGNAGGFWWEREQLGLWLPPLSKDDPQLRNILTEEGWLAPGETPAPAPGN